MLPQRSREFLARRLVRRIRRFLSKVRYSLSVSNAVRRGVETCILQSCDESYLPLFSVTSAVNRQYARKNGYAYFGLVGNVSRIPNTGNFNRFYLLRDLQSFKSLRWALWLDADAIIVDHRRRLEAVIDRSPDKMLLACRGAEKGPWDINDGIFFLNLHHQSTSWMLDYVIDVCDQYPEDNETFYSDQSIVHDWLMRCIGVERIDQYIARYTGSEANLFNYDGPFIRHVLREVGSFAARVAIMKELKNQIQTA